MIRFAPRAVVALACALAAGCAPVASPAAAPARSAAATLAAAPDRFLTTDGATLRYREAGQGEPVLLIHGYLGSLAWPRIADSLAVDHRVIALDLRGFGQSTKSSDPSFFGRKMAGDVVRLMDHLGVRRAHLVGHSMGAMVAAHVARAHPGRVASLGLVAGAFWSDSATAARTVRPWVAALESGGRLRPLFAALYPMMNDSAVTATSDRWMASNDSSSLVAVLRSFPSLILSPPPGAEARVPALAIVGTGDPLLDTSRWLTGWWPGVRLVEVEGANHGTILTHPRLLEEVRALVRANPISRRAAAPSSRRPLRRLER